MGGGGGYSLVMVSTVSRLPGSPFRKMTVAGWEELAIGFHWSSGEMMLTSLGLPSYVTVTAWPGSTLVGTDVKATLPD